MQKEISLKDFKVIPNYNKRYLLSIDGLVYDSLTKRFLHSKFREGVKNPKKHMVSLVSGRETHSTSIESLLFKIFNVDVVCEILEIDNEQWVDVIGYEGEYQVSSHGRVKSLPRIIMQNGKERIMYGHLTSVKRNNGTGYINVLLSKGEDGRETKYVHRLVAEHFLHKPNNESTTVNHLDFNKTNNHISNLEWMNQVENNKHYFDNKDSHFITKELVHKVASLARDNSAEDISKMLKIEHPIIKQILNRRSVKILLKEI